MNTTRKRGAIVTILDNETLLKHGREAMAQQYPHADPTKLEDGPGGIQMLVPVDRGNVAVVNGEGVGSIETDEIDAKVGLYFGYDRFDCLRIELTLTAIADAATARRIDLADGIRTFGARLDSNHYGWFERYDSTYAPA